MSEIEQFSKTCVPSQYTCGSGALQRDSKPSCECLGAKENTNRQHFTSFHLGVRQLALFFTVYPALTPLEA